MSSKKITLEETFEAITQINEELKRMEFDGAFCKTFKLLVDTFSSFFTKPRKLVEKNINDPSTEK